MDYPDAGPHACPDEIISAQKRRAAASAAEGRTSAPEERHAGDLETVTRKRGKK